MLAAALVLPASERTRIDDIVAQVMHVRHIAGLSLGIARRGTRLYVRGYGLRDVQARQGADGYTLYRVGSIAKQFTAALVLSEAERGRIDVGASARSYLPASTGLPPAVTVAQLLDQTSGIATGSAATNVVLQYDPGTAWSYSNANYALLGELLQRVTGTSFPEVMHERIVGPLALASTGCDWPPGGTNIARGYAWNGEWTLAPPAAEMVSGCSAVGLVSNAADLLGWLEHLRAGSVVSSASFRAMTHSSKLGGMPTYYGYGFFVTHWFGYDVAEHPGYVDGFSSQDAIVLGDGLEVAVLTNENTVDLSPLTQSIVAVLDPPANDLLASSIPGEPQNESLQITTALKALLQTPGFAAYGTLESLEFIQRAIVSDLTYDKYRATFSGGAWWVNVGYRRDGSIVSVRLSPVE